MCEILVRLKSNAHSDPAIDAGMFKSGDIVSVEDDGHDWGTTLSNSPYFRIDYLPGIPRADKQYLIQQHKIGITHSAAMKIPELNNIAVNAPQSILAIRRFSVDASGKITDKGQS